MHQGVRYRHRTVIADIITVQTQHLRRRRVYEIGLSQEVYTNMCVSGAGYDVFRSPPTMLTPPFDSALYTFTDDASPMCQSSHGPCIHTTST